MRSVEHRTAAAIAEAALSVVFGRSAVATLREDSPLAAVGLVPADLVCLSDAIAADAAARGVTCILDDEALGHALTVGDVVVAVQSHATVPEERG